MAEFEIQTGSLKAARKVFERAKSALANSWKEERLMLIEAWLQFESKHGDAESYDKVSMDAGFSSVGGLFFG